MERKIQEKLVEIEEKYNVRVLHAVESGSRAWGFASPDSDYDVRFIYVHPLEYYLKLEKTRDVIELPINDLLDINGWDLKKTLTLLHKSNPSVFEWFKSPIVYKATDFSDEFIGVMHRYFLAKSGLYHYLHMAEHNYREYLKGDMVRAKKYFYVLRPLLACKWILRANTPPPMLFDELVASDLPEELRDSVEVLLDLKVNSPELKFIPRVDKVNRYIETDLPKIQKQVAALPREVKTDYQELNELFYKWVDNKR